MSKIFLVSSILLAMSAIAPLSVRAEVGATVASDNPTPRELISLARQGKFKSKGIPGYSNFGSGVRSGKITAEILVESAIATSRLPQNVASDHDYLNALASHLKSGGCGSI